MRLQAQLEGDPFTRVAVDLQRGDSSFTVELVRTPVLEDEVRGARAHCCVPSHIH